MDSPPSSRFANSRRSSAGQRCLRGSTSPSSAERYTASSERTAQASPRSSRILTGVYSASAGQIFVDGQRVKVSSPLDAHKIGLGAVYQDTEVIGDFTVGQNVLLGNEPGGVLLSQSKIHEEASGDSRTGRDPNRRKATSRDFERRRDATRDAWHPIPPPLQTHHSR